MPTLTDDTRNNWPKRPIKIIGESKASCNCIGKTVLRNQTNKSKPEQGMMLWHLLIP